MYKVSVVTPLHNVELNVFEKAYQSMLSQTIGFENIQWIVIAHNCEPHYLPALQEMLGKHDNVIVRGLDNDVHTPSSPRNYGMQFATAPYLGFLDADDSYTAHCLEEAYNNIRETKSDVLIFRRESELEDPSLVPLTELVGWNQLESRIIVESIIAQAIADDSDLFKFVLENDFFEFLPDNSEPLLLSQVSPGMTCEVIVTNRAGLYRYRTGIRISLVEHLPQGNAIIRIVE